jgi:hypothetical protein
LSSWYFAWMWTKFVSICIGLAPQMYASYMFFEDNWATLANVLIFFWYCSLMSIKVWW